MKVDILDTLCLAQVEAALMNANDEVMKDIDGFVSFDYVMRLVESNLRAEMESSLLASLDEVKKRRACLAGNPPRQNSCHLDRILNSGAMMRERLGAIRTRLQRQSGGAVAAAGECNGGVGCT